MIFSISDHIEQIKKGTKTQTRRKAKPNSFIYRVGNIYSIQPCRTCKAIPDGAIVITNRKLELRQDTITWFDARAEGGYTPEDFEELFEKMYPNWSSRYVYTFKYYPKEQLDDLLKNYRGN